MQKPITATVQISIPSGQRLDGMKVKAVANLLLGSVTGLIPENIAMTDTNGNTYKSMLDASDEMIQRLEENDRYMQQKVAVQLDRLLGKDTYAVTVSTALKQAPAERVSITYDPNSRIPIAEQTFSEGLGDQTSDLNRGTNAVSVYLPNGLPAGGADSTQDRNYSRTAREVQYGVSKIQETEVTKAGVVEDITIAVTLNRDALPENTTLEELRELIAKAASPKVTAENVTIAFADPNDPYLSGDRPSNLPKPDETGNPWWVAIGLAIIGSLVLLKMITDKVRKETDEPRRELEILRQQNAQQEQMLAQINQQAATLTQQQTQLAQGLQEQQTQVRMATQQIQTQGAPAPVSAANTQMLTDALNDMASDLAVADEDAAEKIKSWIEAA